jgi:hypothetical protein
MNDQTTLYFGLALFGFGIFVIFRRKLSIPTDFGQLRIHHQRAVFFGLICFECALLLIVFYFINSNTVILRYEVFIVIAALALIIFGFAWALFFEYLHRLRFGPPGHERKRKMDKTDQHYKYKNRPEEVGSIELEGERMIFLTDDGELIDPDSSNKDDLYDKNGG